ncbi:Uncharacterised protein [Raoultella terrigena]|uniref:Uncharacterized protein n=1 Tax=Raoultella terrigena TaxID=577 RepID=A0A4U9D4X5_RAOTE|nr:Uncharacterised protein [Raoultella terrigena]
MTRNGFQLLIPLLVVMLSISVINAVLLQTCGRIYRSLSAKRCGRCYRIRYPDAYLSLYLSVTCFGLSAFTAP